MSFPVTIASLLTDVHFIEKFDQAITDYEAGLKFKLDLLPSSSRQIAEAHYKLSMVLDLTSGRLSDAIIHAQKALESVESRLKELKDGLEGNSPPLPPQTDVEDKKGKGKAPTGKARLVRDDQVQNMSKTQIESEIKELSGLKDDLALKVWHFCSYPFASHFDSFMRDRLRSSKLHQTNHSGAVHLLWQLKH